MENKFLMGSRTASLLLAEALSENEICNLIPGPEKSYKMQLLSIVTNAQARDNF